MKEFEFENSALTLDNVTEINAPGQTLAASELLKVITGDLEAHYWISIDTGEVTLEGTLEAGDEVTLSHFSRQLLARRHDCQYGGEITSEQARVLYRTKLLGILENMYK